MAWIVKNYLISDWSVGTESPAGGAHGHIYPGCNSLVSVRPQRLRGHVPTEGQVLDPGSAATGSVPDGSRLPQTLAGGAGRAACDEQTHEGNQHQAETMFLHRVKVRKVEPRVHQYQLS